MLPTFAYIREILGVADDPWLRYLLRIGLGIILIGTVFYALVEGWSVVDSLYFSVATLATVGYGDLTPKTDGAKLFTVAYIIIGAGTFSLLIGVIIRNATKTAMIRQVERSGGNLADYPELADPRPSPSEGADGHGNEHPGR